MGHGHAQGISKLDSHMLCQTELWQYQTDSVYGMAVTVTVSSGCSLRCTNPARLLWAIHGRYVQFLTTLSENMLPRRCPEKAGGSSLDIRYRCNMNHSLNKIISRVDRDTTYRTAPSPAGRSAGPGLECWLA